MRIIAIEGIDKSGKHTQTKLLAEALREQGYKVEVSEFHRYDTPTGELIAKYLAKEIELTNYTVELIMAADKQNQQVNFKKMMLNGTDFLILDRYVVSQYAYAAAKGLSFHWIKSILAGVQHPDVSLLLDVPVDVSMSRKGKHNNGVNDRYEEDKKFLEKTVEAFKTFIPNENMVFDALESQEEIHSKLLSRVMELIEEWRDEDEQHQSNE